MIGTSFDLDLSQVRGISRASEQAREPILRTWQGFMLRQTRDRYRRQVAPDGRAWPPTRYPGERHVRTLYGRGDLFRSITPYKVDKWSVGIGSNLPYAATHQHGATFRTTRKQAVFLFHKVFRRKHGDDAVFAWSYRITIPQRQFLGFSNEDVNKLEEFAALHLQRALANPR